MELRSDLETELQARLFASNNSGQFPTTRITLLIQNATIWAGGLFWWPSLQRCRKSTAAKNTQSLNYDYYDYPGDILTDSIARLYIDGKKYDRKAFQDLLDYADSAINPTLAPNPAVRIYACYGRQYFVYPSYTGTPPSGNLLLWGNIQHPALVNPTDKPIFSGWDDRGNEAIIQKAMSVALKRIDPGLAQEQEQAAIANLAAIWKKVTDGMQRDQRLNHQMLMVPDYFGFGGGLSQIGNFNIPVDITNIF